MTSFDPSDGELLLTTGVTGSAARMGHRLTIAMRSWQATVRWEGDDPVEVDVAVDIDSFDVVRGEGGVTPLTGAEKAVVRANAMKTLRAGQYPQAHFRSTDIERTGDSRAGSVRISGTIELCGRVVDHTLELHVQAHGDCWRISGHTDIRHTDFGIKRYSMLMGSMKVADEVRVSITAARPLHE